MGIALSPRVPPFGPSSFLPYNMLPVFAASHSARRLPAAPRGNLAKTFREPFEEGGMSPVAIVTASDSGIGQECAKELAENGSDVGITYRSDAAGVRRPLPAAAAGGRP